MDLLLAALQSLDPLIQLLDLDHKMSDGVEKPVKHKGGGDEERVALALHNRFLVAEVLGRGAGIGLAMRSRLVLPVDVEEEEDAEGNDG